MTDIPYILDILSQPKSLQAALEKFDTAPLESLAKSIHDNDFDRILITGMGGSLYAAYPVWLTLASTGLPALWVDTAELIHHTPALVTPRTLFWVFSQSGKSAEVVSAMDLKPGVLLATVNDLESSLAKKAQVHVPINAEVEKTVSTRTYINTLGVGQLAALALLGKDVEATRADLLETASAMQTYLADWESRVEQIGNMLKFPNRLAIMGRGASFGSSCAGVLVLGEASKFMATPYQAGEFRHGPLELATRDLTALIFAGAQNVRDLNGRLLRDLREHRVNAFWVGSEKNDWQIGIPTVPETGLPLMEILPIQLLSIHFAQQIGVEPGRFFTMGKITLNE